MKKILLYHLFPVNNWKEVTQKLLSNVPHDDIIVHVSLPEGMNSEIVQQFLTVFPRVKEVFYSSNSNHPEVDGMEKFRSRIDLTQYSILTYMHSKGVTKPTSQNIKDWTELMRYFIIDRMELCTRAFKRGYLLYGVNKTTQSDFEADFFYAGNFVSVNLTPGMISKIQSTLIDKNYHGLEGFWGKLCSDRQAFNVFYSRIDHYSNPFPESNYKDRKGRVRYSIVSFLYNRYYILRGTLLNFSRGVQFNIRRIRNLYRVTTLREFFQILTYFARRKKGVTDPALHRILIFAVACTDRGIALSTHSPEILQARWSENGKALKIHIRKYTRDLLVFSEFFIEEGHLSFVKTYASPQTVRTVLDAGANIGCAALFLHAYFPEANVVCIEPETSNFDLLKQNININNASLKITCFHHAIWNSITRLSLMQRDHSSDAFHVMEKEVADEVISTTSTLTIPGVMDKLRMSTLDFLKIDIEGAEKILFEDDRHLAEFLPVTTTLSVEVHTEFISASKVSEQLVRFGFQVKVLPHGGDSVFVIANK